MSNTIYFTNIKIQFVSDVYYLSYMLIKQIRGRVDYWRGGIRTMGETVAGSFRRTPVPHSKPSLRFQQPLIKERAVFRHSAYRLRSCIHPRKDDLDFTRQNSVGVIQILIREIHRFPALRLVFP